MSTRIYRGRRLEASIGVIYDLLIQAKGQSNLLGIHLQAEKMATRAAELIDSGRISGNPHPKPLAAAYRELKSQRDEIVTTGIRNPEADFQFELWLFPKGSTTLCIVNTEQEAMLDWFDDLPFVSDYSWWDGSDRPDTITSAKWERRKKDWDKVLPGAGIPSHRCLTLQMFDHLGSLPFDIEAIAQYLPAVEPRLEARARQKHVDEVYRGLIAGKKSEEVTCDIFSIISQAQTLADGDQNRRNQIKTSLSDKVLPLTVEDLRPQQSQTSQAA